MFKIASTAMLLAGALATAQADPVLISQGFDQVGGLTGAGWIINNASTPGGTTSWFQGDQTKFTSHSGAPESYAAVNFNSAPAGGTLANWLITPTFSTATNVAITFWARSDILDGYFDQLSFGMLGADGSLSSYVENQVITTVGEWTQYKMLFGALGDGTTARFGIEYVGSADNANYAGVDDLQVLSVPEPSSWALVGISMLGLAAAARRRPQR